MQELIAKLEAATEGNRTLDWEIHHAMHEEFGAYGDHPHYTTSLDAALTLVPEGWTWFRTHDGWMYVCEESWEDGMAGPQAYGSPGPPALALCIAALRAREKQK